MSDKLRSYASLLYNHMESESVLEDNMRVWRGRVMATAKALGIPEGTYSKVQNRLRSMGCIEQVTRGFRGAALSTFILHYPPTPERWAVESDLTSGPSLDRVSATVEDLKRQLGGINLVKALDNLEQRVRKLERQISKTD